MIISLVTMLVILLSGGPEIFTIPNVEKKVKTVMVDDHRKTEALDLIKVTKKEIKSFNKELKGDIKMLKNDKYRASLQEEDVVQILENALTKRKDHQSYLVDQRIKLRTVMTEDEWTGFMEISSEYFVAKEKKVQKVLAKKDKQADKLMSNIRTSFEKNISDPDNLALALAQYDELESLINQKFAEINNFTFPSNEILHDYHADSEVLVSVYDQKNETREIVYNGILDLRSNILQYLPENEWKAISKSFVGLM